MFRLIFLSYSNVYVGELNTSRTNRIQEYKTMKGQIDVHVKDLIKRIQDEEQDLYRKIDARIQTETEYVLHSFFFYSFIDFLW